MRDFLTSASKGGSIEAAAALEGVVWIQKVSALFLGCLKSQDILYIVSDLLPSSRRTLQLKVAEDVSTLVRLNLISMKILLASPLSMNGVHNQ